MQLNNLVLSDAEKAAFDRALSLLTEAAVRLTRSPPLQEKADRRHGGSRRFVRRGTIELD